MSSFSITSYYLSIKSSSNSVRTTSSVSTTDSNSSNSENINKNTNNTNTNKIKENYSYTKVSNKEFSTVISNILYNNIKQKNENDKSDNINSFHSNLYQITSEKFLFEIVYSIVCKLKLEKSTVIISLVYLDLLSRIVTMTKFTAFRTYINFFFNSTKAE